MKHTFVILLLSLTGLQLQAQKTEFNYNDYFYYRNHQYLQTPSILLSGATLKLAVGDTLGAIALVREAASGSLYDTGFITGLSSLRFITGTGHWADILAMVNRTRARFSDPGKMEIITSDVDKFWELYDRINDKNADELFMQEYIMKGSPGLRTFFEKRMGLRTTSLLTTVRTKYKYYESIRPVTLALPAFRQRIVAAATKLKSLYEKAIFPPTTFVIAHFNAFGTADGGGGQLIGAEFLCDIKTADSSQLGQWEKTNLTDSSKLLGIVVHELIHIEQNTAPARSLLERSINEGAADFISELVLGYHLNSEKIHSYGNLHERELWEKFKIQMHGDDVSQWLYNGFDANRAFPQDLGYFIGYKICQAYYNKAPDKKQAIKDILEIRDFKDFLLKSGYEKTID